MKKLWILFIVFIYAVTLSGCGSKTLTPVSETDYYFDTVVTITLYGEENEAYIQDCFSLCQKYEELFSRTMETSEISAINASPRTKVNVSGETLALIKKGIFYAELSDGKFDITVGALSSLWNFTSENAHVPKASDIQNARNSIGYQNIQITENQVLLTREDTILDLGGIAKGYVADKLKNYLLHKGIHSGIIDLGGNILLLGAKPDGSPYQIGLKKPFGAANETAVILSITDKSIVTSGNYERYFYEDDKLYHHILDTKTGYPVDNELSSVSIISDESVDGDALSTSCFALGLEKGMELIENTGHTEAVFIDSNQNIFYTSGLNEKNGIVTVQ